VCVVLEVSRISAADGYRYVNDDVGNPIFAQSSKTETVTKGFDTGLDKRPFLVFDFRALWRSGLSARVPESQKLKMVGY